MTVNVPSTPTQSKTLTLGSAAPSTVTPDSGKVLSSVGVSIDTSIIKADNIKKNITILGKTGTLEPAKTEQTKILTLGAAAPTTVTPDSGKVLSSVSVNLDTSIIKAANIAKNVTMLGITGTHEGSGGDDDYLTIGGRIFYDASDIYGDNGATYQFFDRQKTEITYYNIDELENAVYYRVEGIPNFDRFYVFDNTSHGSGDYAAVNGIVEYAYWGMDGISTQHYIQYNDGDFCNIIGSGKALSALTLARGYEDQYNWYGDTPTIWRYINHCNITKLNGCGDWFILNNGEHEALRYSGLVNWYDDLGLWSSSEYDDGNTLAFYWNGDEQHWSILYRTYTASCFAARAF